MNSRDEDNKKNLSDDRKNTLIMKDSLLMTLEYSRKYTACAKMIFKNSYVTNCIFIEFNLIFSGASFNLKSNVMMSPN